MNQNSKFSVRDICYAGLFAAVIAVMAQISIPMPLGVPMTMQTFAMNNQFIRTKLFDFHAQRSHAGNR